MNKLKLNFLLLVLAGQSFSASQPQVSFKSPLEDSGNTLRATAITLDALPPNADKVPEPRWIVPGQVTLGDVLLEGTRPGASSSTDPMPGQNPVLGLNSAINIIGRRTQETINNLETGSNPSAVQVVPPEQQLMQPAQPEGEVAPDPSCVPCLQAARCLGVSGGIAGALGTVLHGAGLPGWAVTVAASATGVFAGGACVRLCPNLEEDCCAPRGR